MKTELIKIRYGQKFLFEGRVHRVIRHRCNTAWCDRLSADGQVEWRGAIELSQLVEPVN